MPPSPHHGPTRDAPFFNGLGPVCREWVRECPRELRGVSWRFARWRRLKPMKPHDRSALCSVWLVVRPAMRFADLGGEQRSASAKI